MSTTTAKRPPGARSIDAQIRQARSVLVKLRQTLEDLEDHRIIERAKRRNGKKPCTPLADVARELGIKLPARKA